MILWVWTIYSSEWYLFPLWVCSTDQATAESTDRDFVVIYGSLGILQSLTFLVAVLHMNRLSVAASALIHRTTLSREDAWMHGEASSVAKRGAKTFPWFKLLSIGECNMT